MTGAFGLTVNVIVVLPLPEVLMAVMVYVVAEEAVVGVPEIIPVDALKDKPEGKVVPME